MQDIIIGSDHRGFALKQQIKEYLKANKYFVVDVGCSDNKNKYDSPPIAKEVVDCVKDAKHFCGILVCGSGYAMAIAANRNKGIRAVHCLTPEMAKRARQHNDANVLCLAGEGDDLSGDGVSGDSVADFGNIKKIITAFLNTKPLPDERYKRRIEMLDK